MHCMIEAMKPDTTVRMIEIEKDRSASDETLPHSFSKYVRGDQIRWGLFRLGAGCLRVYQRSLRDDEEQSWCGFLRQQFWQT